MMQRLGDPLAAAHERLDAQKREDAALEVLKPPELAPTPPGSGEVAVFDYPDPADRNVGLHLLDTLRNPDMMAAQAGLERYKLLLDIGCVELDQDLARTIQPTNSIERMLAGQLASAHYTALRLLARSLDHAAHAANAHSQWQREQNVEVCRVANAAARLMSSFNEAALTLQKLRHGGKQVVVVQHVHVSEGGQAVIAGDMTTGGASPVGGQSQNGGTMPCPERSTPPAAHRGAAPRRARKRRARSQPFTANGVAACMEDTSQERREAINTP
jgi:hypothetical protein